MVAIPAKYADLLTDKTKAFATVTTVMKDGSPQVTPIWFDIDGDKIRVNTATGRVKSRTMKEGSKVALAIMDPANPYRYIQIRGKVIKATQTGANEHIDKLAHKYMGKDYPFHQPGEARITMVIEPESVQGMG